MFRRQASLASDSPGAIVERSSVLIQYAAHSREMTRPVIGHIDCRNLAIMHWVNLHGFANLVLNGILDDRCRSMETKLIIPLLGEAGFVVAANPAALEAAARNAENFIASS